MTISIKDRIAEYVALFSLAGEVLMERYEQAVEACRVWLRAIVGSEVISNRSDDPALKLFLLHKRS